MEHTLVTLKRLLNSIDDNELKNYELWIDTGEGVEIIALDKNAITLITNSDMVTVNGMKW
jgi:hypothetical protein